MCGVAERTSLTANGNNLVFYSTTQDSIGQVFSPHTSHSTASGIDIALGHFALYNNTRHNREGLDPPAQNEPGQRLI